MTIEKAKPDTRSPEMVVEVLKQINLQDTLGENLRLLRDVFKDCSDLIVHELTPVKGPSCCVLFIDGLVEKQLVDRGIIEPIVHGTLSTNLSEVQASLTPVGDIKLVTTIGDVTMAVVSGDAALLVDGACGALLYGVRHWEARAVEEPPTESVVRGPHEGFVETLRFNTALLRHKIRSPALKMVSLTIGRITQTNVVVTYIEGLASPPVIQEVMTRLQRIDIDGVLESGYLEEFIEDDPFSPFPQIQNTERPDALAGQLLEGRVAIMVDGTPFALIVPVVFAQLMQATEDYYSRFLIGSFVRALRYLFLFVALLLPSMYVAIITFHQEMLPSALLLSVAAAREGVPFPALVEAFMMEVTFEILRESGIRLPKTMGQAVSIVGALVIGQAAVQAGLVSAPMVIIVSITGISSFAIPRYNASIAIRLLRFPLMFLAGSFGMFGIVAGLCGILIHLCSLRSFGIPYLSPVAPLGWQGLKDLFTRPPHWWHLTRPLLIGKINPIRGAADQRPRPPKRS